MNDATLLGLKPRALEIFHALVTAYLGSGQPIGSQTLARRLRHDLSPAAIRSNMSDLEQAGLLYAPHTSAGRVPTESGLRMFVDGLMEYSPDLISEDRMSIDGECAMRGVSVDELLEKTSRTLSGLSQCASLVLSPASNAELQHFEFVPIGENRALAVLVRMDGKVENRLIDLPPGVPQSAMVRASNYMNARLSGRDLMAASGLIRSEIAAQRAELDEVSQRLVEAGVGLWAGEGSSEDAVLVMRGQSNLLDDIQAGEELDTIRQLFDELEARENALRLLDATTEGDGVKIFIGAENKLFVNTGCSLVIAPYHDSKQNVIGAIGVLGPRHMNYARIIPMVDYTSRAIAAVLS